MTFVTAAFIPGRTARRTAHVGYVRAFAVHLLAAGATVLVGVPLFGVFLVTPDSKGGPVL